MYVRPYPDTLYHHGVKGMKWGIRRDRTKKSKSRKSDRYNFEDKKFHQEKTIVKTKYGETLSLIEDKTPALTRLIAKHSPKIRSELEKSKACTIRDKNGKRIGDLQVYKESKDSLNVVWVGIDDAHRGKGYATAVMKGVTEFAKNNGLSQITLEVPGNSPDARHIYEKEGFVAGEMISDDDDGVWGGLTKMRKKIK